MKLTLLAGLAALSLSAQTAKVEPLKTETAAVRKAVPANELFEVRYTVAELARLAKKYDTEGYHKEADPVSAEQSNWIMNHCKDLGIPQEKIQAECRWNLGLDPDGKFVNGPDGKPVIAEFWREVPPSVQSAAQDKK